MKTRFVVEGNLSSQCQDGDIARALVHTIGVFSISESFCVSQLVF